MMIDKQLIYRISLYILALFIMAFGVVLSINSDLGVTPFSSLPYVVSLITGIDIGVCVFVIFSSFILIQIAILRKEFKYINLSQIVFSSIFGYFVDFAKSVLGDFRIPTYAGQLGMLAFSLVLLACGIAMHLEARLVNMPAEALVAAAAHKARVAFHRAKIPLDCAVVALSGTLSFIFLSEMRGVREGTVISAILVGKLIPVMRKMIILVICSLGFKRNEEIQP